jgi:hypothetical protein
MFGIVLFFYLIAGTVALGAARSGALRRNLDSPSPMRRRWGMFLTYWLANLISCFASVFLYGALFDTAGSKPSWPPELGLLLGPIPLAVPIWFGLLRVMRWTSRRERRLGRRLGLLPRNTSAARPPELRSRARDFNSLDLRDPEIVRELARRHWQEINHALACDGDPSVAADAQRQFLDEFVATLAPELRTRVSDAYMQESEHHLREFARLSALQRDRVQEQLDLRRRMERRPYIVLAVLLGGWLLLVLYVELT